NKLTKITDPFAVTRPYRHLVCCDFSTSFHLVCITPKFIWGHLASDGICPTCQSVLSCLSLKTSCQALIHVAHFIQDVCHISRIHIQKTLTDIFFLFCCSHYLLLE